MLVLLPTHQRHGVQLRDEGTVDRQRIAVRLEDGFFGAHVYLEAGR